MSLRFQRILAGLVALVILAAGVAYSGSRHTTYQSDASVALSPTPVARKDPNVLANLLSSFSASGTIGTFVELISSQDTIRRAGVTGVGLTVRAIPDTRAMQVSTTGPRDLVTPALNAVIGAAIARQGEVGDVWQLQVLGSPSPAASSGTSKKLLLVASVVLAALGALFVLAVLRRAQPDTGGAPGVELDRPRGLEPMPLPGPSSPRHVLASEADITFHLEGFRYIPASTTTVLVQIAGYWRSAVPQALDDPVLLLYTRYVVHALPSVASPEKQKPVAGPDSPLWRESYSAPAEIFYRHQRLALRASPDVVVGLPDPVERRIVTAADRDAADVSGRQTSARETPVIEGARGPAAAAAGDGEPAGERAAADEARDRPGSGDERGGASRPSLSR